MRFFEWGTKKKDILPMELHEPMNDWNFLSLDPIDGNVTDLEGFLREGEKEKVTAGKSRLHGLTVAFSRVVQGA